VLSGATSRIRVRANDAVNAILLNES